MKKLLSILSLSIVVVFATVSFSIAQTYTITQLTDNAYDDIVPQINNNGHVAWCGYDGNDNEIFLYNGTTTTQLTNNDYNDFHPQINNNGDVVWYGYDGSDWEIFLYDGTSTTQITNDTDDDRSPRINDNGDMIWQGRFDGSRMDLFLYDRSTSTTIKLTSNAYPASGYGPQLNNNKDVVWQVCPGTLSTMEVFLYNGSTSTTTQLTHNYEMDQGVQINNNRFVFWHGRDISPQHVILRYDILTSTTSPVIRSSDPNNYLSWPQVNDNGDVVCYGYDGSDWEIFLYDGTSTIQITNNLYDDRDPKINESGQVVWQAQYDSEPDFEIFLYDGTTITQLTDNSYTDYMPQINASGEIVWMGYDGTDPEIFLASRVSEPEDDEGPITSDVVLNPCPVGVDTNIYLAAYVDDSFRGDSDILSAEYNIDGGDFFDMTAQDGFFDEVSEEVEADIGAFSVAGVHDVCVYGIDSNNNVGPEECTFLVVYDSEGGFVTGGGWIWSPQGPYEYMTQEGKASFGFVSRYKKGADVPTGETEFQFRAADLNFHSDSYAWLVVAGDKAKYKGVGTINGEGEYKFMLTAIDADLNQNDNFEVDRFRIRIWYEEALGENVVYDNALGDDSDEATTEISGGSIKIHKSKNS